MNIQELSEQYKDIQVNLAMRGLSKGHLPPQLWEDLRLRLQDIYRRATGEEFATLIIEDNEHAF